MWTRDKFTDRRTVAERPTVAVLAQLFFSLCTRHAITHPMVEPQPIDNTPHRQRIVSSHTTETYDVDTVRLSAFALVLITILAYQPVWHAGFVWDDDALIVGNPLIQASDGLYRLWFTTEAPDYWPLTSSVWWLEWRLWGNRPMGYHAVNVLLHAANAVLVWMILRRLKIPGAWLAAVVFAVHPVNVATVAWVSEQKNTLSMFFFLVAMLLYLRFDGRGGCRCYGLSLAAFLLALLSKTSVVMLPLVLLGCVWWMRGGVQRQDVLCIWPFFALSLALGFVGLWFHHNRALVLGGLTDQTGNVLSRVAAAGWAPWFYLYKVILPWNLCAIYPKWDVDSSHWVSYMPGLILVGGLALFWWKRQAWGRPLFFGLGYFVVTLLPVLGFFYISFYAFSWVADPWQYIAIAAPIALVVAAGAVICRRIGEPGKHVGVLASVAVVALLGAATWARSCVYESSETLWRDTVARNPNAWVAHYNLANAFSRTGRMQEAIRHYERVVRLKPDYVEANINLAFVLLQVSRVDDAIGHLEQAVRINPDSVEGQYDLGNIYLQVGRVQDAIVHLERAVQLRPDYAEAQYILGNALLQVGKLHDAIVHYEEAVRVKPDFTDARANLQLARQALASMQQRGATGQR